jgi:multisubunit Na+/H+ antiporter MnhB subunit
MSSMIDLLLALGLVGLAMEIAAGQSLFRSIVTLAVFGLVMAVAWARLEAPDLALAEAALGAGLTGALLLVSYRRLAQVLPRRTRRLSASRLAIPLGVLATALVAVVGVAAIGLTPRDDSAGVMVREVMAQQPIENPVTAVLLVFRGYDTLLELAVLLAAWLGSRLVLGNWVPAPAHSASTALPLVGALLCVVVPVAVLVAGHLLHAGGDAPGGAFQAGAVLAAAGVLLALTRQVVALPEPPPWQRVVLVLGIVVFSSIGLMAMAYGDSVLELPGKWAIYAVESAMLVSIALPLVLLFTASGGLGVRPPSGE